MCTYLPLICPSVSSEEEKRKIWSVGWFNSHPCPFAWEDMKKSLNSTKIPEDFAGRSQSPASSPVCLGTKRYQPVNRRESTILHHQGVLHVLPLRGYDKKTFYCELFGADGAAVVAIDAFNAKSNKMQCKKKIREDREKQVEADPRRIIEQTVQVPEKAEQDLLSIFVSLELHRDEMLSFKLVNQKIAASWLVALDKHKVLGAGVFFRTSNPLSQSTNGYP
ncbi:hypothetical protein RUM43_005326 [Polyplax serrata]|uniref:Uncharacterized protein n=1 Tax=Polyplax serrata TaxID=468196 RepID=A0AAN8PIS7_POLSC